MLLVGCGEAEFVGGFASGVASMTRLSEETQNRFVDAINELEAETARINSLRDNLVVPVVKPATIRAAEKAYDRAKDPVSWIALASIVGNAVGIGRASKPTRAR